MCGSHEEENTQNKKIRVFKITHENVGSALYGMEVHNN